ncbi:hypothetical protein [Mycetocola miduiensis]|nr:hypothetical protein [Mycetocola miduiensis]
MPVMLIAGILLVAGGAAFIIFARRLAPVRYDVENVVSEKERAKRASPTRLRIWSTGMLIVGVVLVALSLGGVFG